MKHLLLIGCFAWMVSCNSEKHKEYCIQEETWILKNEVLKESILNYIDSVNYPYPRGEFVRIIYRSLNDSTCSYSLTYYSDIYGLMFDPPLMVFYLEDYLIGFTVSGLKDLSISNSSLVEIMKSRFPDQYQYYLENGLYPPNTGGPLIWELTFQNGKLISKEVIMVQ